MQSLRRCGPSARLPFALHLPLSYRVSDLGSQWNARASRSPCRPQTATNFATSRHFAEAREYSLEPLPHRPERQPVRYVGSAPWPFGSARPSFRWPVEPFHQHFGYFCLEQLCCPLVVRLPYDSSIKHFGALVALKNGSFSQPRPTSERVRHFGRSRTFLINS